MSYKSNFHGYSRLSVYSVPSDPSIRVRGWKNGWGQVLRHSISISTLARGLFTREMPNNSQEEWKASMTYHIAARGYDKFSNIGEVPWTTVGFLFYILLCLLFVIDCILQAFEANTVAPYSISLKSNGGLILTAALTLTSQKLYRTKYQKENEPRWSRCGVVQGQDRQIGSETPWIQFDRSRRGDFFYKVFFKHFFLPDFH